MLSLFVDGFCLFLHQIKVIDLKFSNVLNRKINTYQMRNTMLLTFRADIFINNRDWKMIEKSTGSYIFDLIGSCDLINMQINHVIAFIFKLTHMLKCDSTG